MAALSQGVPLILRIMASSVTAANRAGKIIRDVWSQGELGIVDKGKNDFQTEADRSAERCIIASLSQQFPSVKIIGEEGSGESEVPSDWLVTDGDPEILRLDCPAELQCVTDEEVVIWVDPLDGTTDFTEGLLDNVTVLVGVAVGNRAIGGVIHQPYYNHTSGSGSVGRTLWGIKGIGIGGFTPVTPPVGERIITTTRSHMKPMVQKAIAALQADTVLGVGGTGYKVMLLMEGKAHAYIFAHGGTKRWDTCAPEAILEAMGGRLTDVHGKHYEYDRNTGHPNTRGVLATARDQDHNWYIERVPEEIKQALK